MGDGRLREQQRGVDGFGAVRAQHGGQDGAGGDVDGDRQLGPAQGGVVEDCEDVQAGGVDLDLLARAQRDGRGERPPLPRAGDTVSAAVDVLARVGEGGDQPVEGGLGAHRDRVPMSLREDPGRDGEQGLDGALGAAAPAPDRLLHRGHDPLVRAPREARCASGAVVEQPPQTLLAVVQPHLLHRGAADLPEAERGELVGLGPLTLGEGVPLRVVALLGHEAGLGAVGVAGLHLPDVSAPRQRPFPGRRRGGLEQAPLRRRLRLLAGLGADEGERGVGEQVPGQHHFLPLLGNQVDALAGQADDLPAQPPEADLPADRQHRPPATPSCHRAHTPPPPQSPATPAVPIPPLPATARTGPGPTRTPWCRGESSDTVRDPCHRAWKTAGRTVIGVPTA